MDSFKGSEVKKWKDNELSFKEVIETCNTYALDDNKKLWLNKRGDDFIQYESVLYTVQYLIVCDN